MEYPVPVIYFSRCLTFEPCRYNGEIISDPFIDVFKKIIDARTFCPEVEMGFGVPRPSIRIVEDDKKELHFYQPATGVDATDRMKKYSDEVLSKIDVVDGFILKGRSPSCGIKDVKIYPMKEKTAAKGEKTRGFFGGAVIDRFPSVPVEDEGRLTNYLLREQFLCRVYSSARLRKVRESGSMNELVRFHTINKFLFLAYNQAGMRKLGNITANAAKKPFSEVIGEYSEVYKSIFTKPMRKGSAVNVLLHNFGFFSEKLSAGEKKYFLDSVERYKNGKVPLAVCTAIIRSYAVRFEEKYILDQTFFSPFPEELVDIKDSGMGRDL